MELLRMPRASENMSEGTVGDWFVKEGDTVEASKPVVEIITEKAQFELECEVGGTLLKVLAPSRSTLPVGYVLAILAFENEEPDISAIETENERLLREHIDSAVASAGFSVQTSAKAKTGKRVPATPKARRLAKNFGVSIGDVKESLKVGGIVEEEHVKRFLEGKDR